MNHEQDILYPVTIIMSTYNGTKYLKEQLDSLLNQQGVSINLFVRDDGSKDDTIKLLNLYADKFNSMKIIPEDNIGATASFHRAAKLAFEDVETEYYAFCDQDDIWLSDKLLSGIRIIGKEKRNRPNLYFSNLMMVDNSGNLLGNLLDDRVVSCKRYNALASIGTYGCTCVFNRSALEMFCRLDESKNYIYHDNWLYSVCVFLGSAFYDKESHIRYRQTGENVSGNKKIGVAVWVGRLKTLFRLKSDKRIYESIAKELLANFDKELQPDDKEFLTCVANYRNSFKEKWKLLISKRMRTSSVSKNVCIIGRIILGRL